MIVLQLNTVLRVVLTFSLILLSLCCRTLLGRQFPIFIILVVQDQTSPLIIYNTSGVASVIPHYTILYMTVRLFLSNTLRLQK